MDEDAFDQLLEELKSFREEMGDLDEFDDEDDWYGEEFDDE